MSLPHDPNSTPVPSDPAAVSAPTRSRGVSAGLFAGGALLGVSTGLALGTLDWAREWTLPNLDMSVVAQPIATVLTGIAAIGAAGLALHNGNRTRENDRENHEAARQHDKEQREAAERHAVVLQEEAAKRDTERSLRDRFFKITETLSEGTNYVKREAGIYALVALADDWAVFHRDNFDAAKREQQTCLNVIVGQLRDPLSIESSSTHLGSLAAENNHHKEEKPQHDPALLTFKNRVQNLLWERFRPSGEEENGVWSHLELDLSNCHLYEVTTGQIIVRNRVFFNNARFHGPAQFHNVRFHGFIRSNHTRFHGPVHFHNVRFHGTAEFNKVRFGGFVWFSHAHFHGSSAFNDTHFHGSSAFNDTHFHGSSAFKYTHFHGSNWFTHVNFCSTLTWIQGDEHESEIFFSTVRFKATKATVLEENAAGVLEEVVKNAVFSVDCPFDSQETTE